MADALRAYLITPLSGCPYLWVCSDKEFERQRRLGEIASRHHDYRGYAYRQCEIAACGDLRSRTLFRQSPNAEGRNG